MLQIHSVASTNDVGTTRSRETNGTRKFPGNFSEAVMEHIKSHLLLCVVRATAMVTTRAHVRVCCGGGCIPFILSTVVGRRRRRGRPPKRMMNHHPSPKTATLHGAVEWNSSRSMAAGPIIIVFPLRPVVAAVGTGPGFHYSITVAQ